MLCTQAMARLAVVAALLSCASADLTSCQHTFPNGKTFDLTPLRRSAGLRDWYADDRNGNMYYFNVCSDASQVPEACVSLQKAIQAPVYQVTNQSDCFWLGQLKSMEWELIDDQEPAAGVELYYFDGEQCRDGVARDVRIQLFCDPEAGVGKPLDYYVLEEDCHYSITWPSKYGCPADSGWTFMSMLYWGLVLFGIYMGVGCAFNITQNGAAFGPEAMPNAEFWQDVSGRAASAFEGARGGMAGAMSSQKTSYESVDNL